MVFRRAKTVQKRRAHMIPDHVPGEDSESTQASGRERGVESFQGHSATLFQSHSWFLLGPRSLPSPTSFHRLPSGRSNHIAPFALLSFLTPKAIGARRHLRVPAGGNPARGRKLAKEDGAASGGPQKGGELQAYKKHRFSML